MQTKLTLTIDQTIIKQAKIFARSKGRSLSDLIENYLKTIITENQGEIKLSSSIKKLKGSIQLPEDFDYKNELSDMLSSKHGL